MASRWKNFSEVILPICFKKEKRYSHPFASLIRGTELAEKGFFMLFKNKKTSVISVPPWLAIARRATVAVRKKCLALPVPLHYAGLASLIRGTY